MATLEQLTSPLRHEQDRGRIVGRLNDVANARVDLIVPHKALLVNFEKRQEFALDLPEPLIRHDGVWDRLTGDFTRAALRQIAEKLGIPLAYLDRLFGPNFDLANLNVNVLGHRHKGNTLFRLLCAEDGWVLRAVLSDTYKAIDNTDLFTAFGQGLAEADISLGDCETELDWTNDRFRMRVTVPQIALAVPDLLEGYRSPWSHRPGSGIHDRAQPGEGLPPVLWAGLELSNSETGGGAATITPRAEFLICKNGARRTEDMVRNVHLGGKLEEGAVQWSHETHLRALALIRSKVADATRQFISVEYLEKMANEMRAAKGVEVTSASAAVQLVQDRLGFTENETRDVFDCFMRGGDSTVLGLGQAVTAAAQLTDDSDRQAEMEDAFWAIVRQPGVFAEATA